jgi:hypothetical protein
VASASLFCSLIVFEHCAAETDRNAHGAYLGGREGGVMNDLTKIKTDVVGSLLRPANLKDARMRSDGKIRLEEPHAVEEAEAVHAAVHLQEDAGFDVVPTASRASSISRMVFFQAARLRRRKDSAQTKVDKIVIMPAMVCRPQEISSLFQRFGFLSRDRRPPAMLAAHGRPVPCGQAVADFRNRGGGRQSPAAWSSLRALPTRARRSRLRRQNRKRFHLKQILRIGEP